MEDSAYIESIIIGILFDLDFSRIDVLSTGALHDAVYYSRCILGNRKRRLFGDALANAGYGERNF